MVHQIHVGRAEHLLGNVPFGWDVHVWTCKSSELRHVHVFDLAWCAFVYPDGCGNVQNPDISHNTLSVLIFDPSSLEVSQVLVAKECV